MSKRGPELTYDCPWTFRVTEYLEDELDSNARDGFESHLFECGACSDELARERATLERLATIDPPLTRDARDTAFLVLARAADDANRPGAAERVRRRRSRSLALASAAAFVLLALAWRGVFDTGRDGERRGVPADPTEWIETASRGGEPASSGGPASRALARGLGWLAEAQEDDGRWDPARWGGLPEYDVGVTGLAVLALTHGEEERHRNAALRGGRFLATRQDRNGRIGGSSRGGLYNHAVATRALLTLVDRSGGGDWRSAADRALRYLLANQAASGAWRYPDSAADSGSVAVSVWPLRCLVVARDLGWRDLDEPIRRGYRWLAGAMEEEHERSSQGGVFLGAGGHVCGAAQDALGWLVEDDTTELTTLRRRVLDRLARDHFEDRDYYRAFLASRALRDGREAWKRSRRGKAAEELLARQETSGRHEGSWKPDERWSLLGGRLCSTALATLALYDLQ